MYVKQNKERGIILRALLTIPQAVQGLVVAKLNIVLLYHLNIISL